MKPWTVLTLHILGLLYTIQAPSWRSAPLIMCRQGVGSLASGIPCLNLTDSELSGATALTDGNTFLFMSYTHKCYAFPILTKPLSCTVAETLAVWGATAKLEHNFFILLCNFTDRRFVSYHRSLQPQHTNSFLSDQEFLLKRSTLRFLSGIGCHCYSCTTGSWFSKIRSLEHKYCYTATADLITKMATQ